VQECLRLATGINPMEDVVFQIGSPGEMAIRIPVFSETSCPDFEYLWQITQISVSLVEGVDLNFPVRADTLTLTQYRNNPTGSDELEFMYGLTLTELRVQSNATELVGNKYQVDVKV